MWNWASPEVRYVDAVDHDDNDAGVIILIYCVISLNWASSEVIYVRWHIVMLLIMTIHAFPRTYCVISLNWASPEVKDTLFKHLKMSNV